MPYLIGYEFAPRAASYKDSTFGATAIAKLNADEICVAKTLLEQNRQVQVVARSAQPTADFLFDGTATELKTLQQKFLILIQLFLKFKKLLIKEKM
jgi:hypothetical protein